MKPGSPALKTDSLQTELSEKCRGELGSEIKDKMRAGKGNQSCMCMQCTFPRRCTQAHRRHRTDLNWLAKNRKCEILVPQPRIKPLPLALDVWNFNHWTTSKVPFIHFFLSILYICTLPLCNILSSMLLSHLDPFFFFFFFFTLVERNTLVISLSPHGASVSVHLTI